MPDPGWPAAPYGYRTEVREEWIDYNGHLHDVGYAIVLSEANEVLFADLGLSEGYRVNTGRGMYTVESHIHYLAETKRGSQGSEPAGERRCQANAGAHAAEPPRWDAYSDWGTSLPARRRGGRRSDSDTG